MKKILFFLLLTIIYLNIAYAYFYNFLKQKGLLPPTNQTKTVIFSKADNQLIKYVALGDSLTVGVGTSSYQNSYPYLVAKKLAVKNNVELINLALSGSISQDVSITQIPQVIPLKPDLVTLLIGINDIHHLKSPADFENNLTNIVKILKQNTLKIYLLSIPFLGSDKILFPPYNLILDYRTQQFNQIIEKVANSYQVGYIDLYYVNKQAQFYSVDQFHPSEAGYSLWADYINANLNR